MTLDEITERGIDPALKLLPARMDSYEARVMLLTIGQQESKFLYRRQIVGGQPVGPAKSFWQGEKGGGMVKGVRTHPATAALAAKLYEARGVAPDDTAIWNAIENDDVLAAGLARLLLFTDPKPLPAVNDSSGSWSYYLRTWRPGQPHQQTWPGFHLASRRFLGVSL
ncbi:hypothetical protein [Xenophilus sp.]|uniref:hypothetical protein n=1 Tax=Xenophilus sp. TaxID=1873499 RepID=UPI0037DDB09D